MIAKRLAFRLLEYVMEAATDRGGHRSDREASVLRYDLVERGNSVGPAVSVCVNHYKAYAAKRNAWHGVGVNTPPCAYALRVRTYSFPALYDGRLLPPAVFP